MTHRHWEELAAGHALDALEPEDEEQFLRHLPGCAPCERALVAWREAAGQVAYAVAAAPPPPGLWREIAAGVAESGRPAVFAEPPVPVPRPGGLVTALRRPWLAGAVAGVLALGAAGWAVTVRTGRDLATRQVARLRTLAAVVTAPDTRRVDLRGAGTARATAFVRGGEVWLVVEGLARNDPRTSVYVLWRDGRPGPRSPVAAFDVVAEGLNVFDPMPLAGGTGGLGGFAVSLESGRRAPDRPASVLLSGGLAG